MLQATAYQQVNFNPLVANGMLQDSAAGDFDDLPDDLIMLLGDDQAKVEDIDNYINQYYNGCYELEMLSDATDEDSLQYDKAQKWQIKQQNDKKLKPISSNNCAKKSIGKKLTNFNRKKDLTVRDLRLLIKRKIPPLMKQDIRRQYMNMFANVWNSHDECLIGDFIGKYCVDNVFMVNECAHYKELNLPPRLELTGLQPIFEFWHGRMAMFPDTVFELLTTKVRSKYNPDTLECVGSVVEARIAVSGTRMYQLSFEDWVPSLHQQQQQQQQDDGTLITSFDFANCAESARKNAKLDDVGTFLAVDEDSEEHNDAVERGGYLLQPSQQQHQQHHHLSREKQYSQKLQQEQQAVDARHSIIAALAPLPVKQQFIDTSALPEFNPASTTTAVAGEQSLSLLDFCTVNRAPQRMRMEGIMMLHVDRLLRIQRFDFRGVPK